MGFVQSSIDSALAVVVILGLPIVILFVVGWYIHWVGRRRSLLASSGRARGASRSLHSRSKQGPQPRCWEIKQCPARAREDCPARRYPHLSCWQAEKITHGGRIKAECPSCPLFLSQVKAG